MPYRQQNFRRENNAEVGPPALRKNSAEAVPNARINQRAGDDSKKSADHERAQGYIEKCRYQIHQPERHERDEPQEQQIAECVSLEAVFKTRKIFSRPSPKQFAEHCARKQKQQGRTKRRAYDRIDSAVNGTEHKAARHRQQSRARNRQGDRSGINRDKRRDRRKFAICDSRESHSRLRGSLRR